MYYGRWIREIAESIRKLVDLPERLSGVGEEITRNTETVRLSNERERQEGKNRQEWAGEILAEYKKSEIAKASNDDRQYQVQNSLRWATWLAFIAAAIYAGIAAFQLHEMARATKATQDAAKAAQDAVRVASNTLTETKASNERQAKLTDEARRSSEGAAQDSLKATIDNSRSDLRAYVTTTLYRGLLTQGCDLALRVCVDFQFVNVGRTPAVNLEVNAVLVPYQGPGEHVPEGTVENMPLPPYKGMKGSVLGTSGPVTAHAFANQVGLLNKPCGSHYHEPPCGHTVYGVIRYQDIFGGAHETGFCMYFPEESSIPESYCQDGNWFDVRPKSKNGANSRTP